MKRLSLLPLFILFQLSACGLVQNEPELIIDPNRSFLEGEWKLVKSMGSMINIVLEGDDLKRKEVYTFFNDGTYSKTVEDEDYKASATGTYEIDEISEDFNENYLAVAVLSQTGGDAYAYNCSSGDIEKEYLHISKEGTLENIIWAPCDGPYLVYQKLED
ncbi:hypothetical protein [Algoriphagus zhangzhouensis]|uniref:Lipocalin-like domain-containing protein n=1 Tax=Algoriphagus zhangzhouensis TaxID=1073327 RepID=A0A1M7Z3M5_9BACT|nr:hypothetical protein [Algoriphagus zhangzhouensis]TDY48466.1 hypothetical protein A8938_0150 [Algoriphagus zhangzhouensis]SHO59513.1 hypothetical protein SAMN04488108_0150 [Algoriphagus zhangzhouensis]